MNAQTTSRIAIIGAGLAGLTCATRLVSRGYQVDILDKSRGPAGRMSTRRGVDEAKHWQCDHGAQYFTADDHRFQKQVEAWRSAGVAAPWQGRLVSHDGTSFAPLQQVKHRFVGTPRMTAPATYLASQLQAHPDDRCRIRYGQTVFTLANTQSGWQLETLEDGVLPEQYQSIVLAVPAPQAAVLLQSVWADGAANALAVQMRGCWAVMVRCEVTPTIPADGVFVNHGPLSWVARDSSKPGRPDGDTWLLHASQAWSEAHLEDDPAVVMDTLLRAFTELGGPAPERVKASAHRWRYADTRCPQPDGSWWQANLRIGVCGDWLHGGKVQGAWLSGIDLAERLIQSAPSP